MMFIKQARQAAKLKQEEAAELLNVPLSTFRKWEQGIHEPGTEMIIKMADLYHTSTDYLLGSKFAMKAIPMKAHQVPVLGRIAAGAEREALQNTDTYHATTDDIWSLHQNAYWLVVAGNSMNRLFPEGSLVLVDPDVEVRDGDVAAVMVNGDDATLKRVFFENGMVRLHPESYDVEYQDRVIDPEDLRTPFRPLGKVVSFTAPDNWRA